MTRQKRIIGATAIAIACVLFGRCAETAEASTSVAPTLSPYCRRVRARTQADVALLRAPRVAVSAIRFPSSNRIDLGPTVGENYQARAAIAFSPLDFYRGSVLQDATEADCRVHEAADRMRVELDDLTDLGRLSALRAQAAYLKSHRAEWNAFLAKAADQLAARLLTAVEYDELRRLTQGLERKTVSVESEADSPRVALGHPRAAARARRVDEGLRRAGRGGRARLHATARPRQLGVQDHGRRHPAAGKS